MTYLVDANVLSEPTKLAPNPRGVQWLRDHEPDIAVDPIVLGEMRFGILRLPRGMKRAALVHDLIVAEAPNPRRSQLRRQSLGF